MGQKEEIDYIKRILEGETTLFSYFLDRYSRPIYSLVLQIISCREDAEELTQDSFVKAYRKLDTYKGDCSFSTWLYRIAYNTAISATRKQKKELSVIDEQIIDNISDDEADEILCSSDNEERIKKMEWALTQLNANERVLITLFYNENKSVDELASIFRLTPTNIKVKLHRIRKKICALINQV
ncbi:RNA polymerase sigma factor [Bacteroides sedimenti]|uniref:RNA polymerase sigma factor n=1 Tax=Bacteroides sedimenti TaxID=2136147 RepID=A0ABN6ZCZ6_9BACE